MSSVQGICPIRVSVAMTDNIISGNAMELQLCPHCLSLLLALGGDIFGRVLQELYATAGPRLEMIRTPEP